VVTALVAQETSDVNAIHTLPEEFVRSQFQTVTNDTGVDALKIGMTSRACHCHTFTFWFFNVGALISSSLLNCVISLITKKQIPVVVLDPVVVTAQLTPDSLAILRDQLLPMVTLITPTVKEAAILLDRNIVSLDDVRCAAQDLHRLGSKYVLIRGGHLALCAPLQGQADSAENNVVVDVLFDGLDFTLFKSSRLPIETAYSPR
jgi:hydroxymethylpyrimidine/phosphomethylpyrimidine kinase